jgi:hypothetical protein
MDPKLAILFVLISGIIALSRLDEDSLARMRRRLVDRNWRKFVQGRRNS